jgi:hypothetical protein
MRRPAGRPRLTADHGSARSIPESLSPRPSR